jgi:hypothetical protein
MVLKCDDSEGGRRSVGKMEKYYKESRRRGT